MHNSAGTGGQTSIGITYDFELLADALYESDPIPNINRERTNNSTATFLIRHSISDNFSIIALVPYRSILNEKVLFRGQNPHQSFGGKYFRESGGIGDIILLTSFRLNALNFLPNAVFSAGLKLANGEINAVDVYDERISDNLQVGTGSIDPIASLYISKQLSSFILSAGIFTRISGSENIYGYKYGNELHFLSDIDYTENDLWFGGLQLRYLLTTRDYYEYGKVARDRGGKWLYASPKIGTKITEKLNLELSTSFPLWQFVNESQLTSQYQIQLNTVYRFNS